MLSAPVVLYITITLHLLSSLFFSSQFLALGEAFHRFEGNSRGQSVASTVRGGRLVVRATSHRCQSTFAFLAPTRSRAVNHGQRYLLRLAGRGLCGIPNCQFARERTRHGCAAAKNSCIRVEINWDPGARRKTIVERRYPAGCLNLKAIRHIDARVRPSRRRGDYQGFRDLQRELRDRSLRRIRRISRFDREGIEPVACSRSTKQSR